MSFHVSFFVAMESSGGKRYSKVNTCEAEHQHVHQAFNDWLREQTAIFQQAVPSETVTITNCKIIR